MAGDLIIDKVAATSVATKTSLMRGLAKAWANLNGSGTIALRDSINISSVTDNGVGDYYYNLTNVMANTNFMFNSTGDSGAGYIAPGARGAMTASRMSVRHFAMSAGAVAADDPTQAMIAALGDLA